MPHLPLPSPPPLRPSIGPLRPFGFVVRWAPVWLPLVLLWQFSERGLKPALAERLRLRQLAPEVEAGYDEAAHSFEVLNAEAQAWQDPVYRERLRRIELLGPPEVLASDEDDPQAASGHAGARDFPFVPRTAEASSSDVDSDVGSSEGSGWERESLDSEPVGPLASDSDPAVDATVRMASEGASNPLPASDLVPAMFAAPPPTAAEFRTPPGAERPWRVE